MCLIVFDEKDEKKLRLAADNSMTLEEGCNKYLKNCRVRSLREGTINHYPRRHTQFFRYFDKKMQVSEIEEKTHQMFVV